MINSLVRTFHSARRLLCIPGLVALALAFANPALAQQGGFNLSTDNVTVDLSVIGGGASGPGQPPYVAGTGGGTLLVPGSRLPRSKLHVAVPPATAADRIKLRPPGSEKKKPVRQRKAAAKKPSPPPAEAKAPPAPLATAPPPPEPAAPEKAPAAKVSKAAPPAPPPPAEPAQAKKTETTAAPPPAPAPAPAKTEQASLPPAGEPVKPGRAMQIMFDAAESKLPDGFKDPLQSLAEKLKGQDALRIQLMAYAGGEGVSASKSRRLSLSRALSVRSFLIENGVRSTRIDVRALGDKTSEAPKNRVDVNIVER